MNAIADYLRLRLRVPNVYINPSSTVLSRVDVLAADAAGSGDIHAAEVKLLENPIGTKALSLHIEAAKTLPAHYKYIAIPKGMTNVLHDPHLFFSKDGIGRVGVLLILESDDGPPTLELAVKPERFQLEPTKLAEVERFIAHAKPDMYVRV